MAVLSGPLPLLRNPVGPSKVKFAGKFADTAEHLPSQIAKQQQSIGQGRRESFTKCGS